jgi:uncharacterized protein
VNQALLFAALVLVLPVAGVLVLVALQRHVLFPPPKPNAVLSSPHHVIREVTIPVNGKLLRGLCAHPATGTAATRSLLYFNGRREHPTSVFRVLPETPDLSVLCFFYDRLGLSWRKPGEQELVADGIAVFDWWARESAMEASRISVAGRSLGSGIAVQVAAARPIRQLVVLSPPDRLIAAIHARLPWVPHWWLRDGFRSCDHIARVRCPCLLIVADHDATVPPDVSRALFARWDGSLTEFVVRGCSHRGVMKRQEVHRALADFVLT